MRESLVIVLAVGISVIVSMSIVILYEEVKQAERERILQESLEKSKMQFDEGKKQVEKGIEDMQKSITNLQESLNKLKP